MTPVLQIVRGAAPLSALREAGVSITARGVVRTKTPIPAVTPSLGDLSAGLLRHNGRKSLAKWATLVVHAEFIDIAPPGNSPDWDAILGAIWDAVGGAKAPEPALQVATKIVSAIHPA